MDISNLIYELRKCKDCSCSRCYLNGTEGCFVDLAVRELNRYEQAMDSLKTSTEEIPASYLDNH